MTMKSWFLFLVPFFMLGCKPEEKENIEVRSDFSLMISPELGIENPKLISVIREYIENNTGDPSRVYTLLVKRENILTTSFQLGSIITFSQLNEAAPIGYFEVNNDIVLVCTGLESLCKRDQAFIKELSGIVGDRIVNDLLPDGTKDPNYLPKMFDPSTWEVKVTGDSVVIEKGVMNLLGPPVVEIIKFTPPKK